MKAGSSFYRSGEIRRIRGELEQDSFPLLQMLLLVTLTVGSGFFTSFVLLRSGVVEMWIRYLLSFGVAYVVFLFLLWLWPRTRADQYSDLAEVVMAPDEPSALWRGRWVAHLRSDIPSEVPAS